MKRRDLLRLALLSGAAACCGIEPGRGYAAYSYAAQPLRKLALTHGLFYGSSARRKQLESDDQFRAIFLLECGILVPELELKWQALRPAPDRYDFADSDWMCNFAKSNRMLFRGHTLVWDAALPAWFNDYASQRNAAELMTSHIKTVVGRYYGKVHSWDVVNEAIEPEDGRSDGLKNSPWLRLVGPQYIEMAFHAARAADSNAILVYNENFLEPETAYSERKRQITLQLLTDLKKRNVPIDALGIQAHVFAEAHVSGPRISHFLDEIGQLGLQILITEMDVRDKNLPPSIETRDRLVAQQYTNFLDLAFSKPATKGLLTWGLTDRYTWISKSHPRPDGLPVRPLLYDDDYRPKLDREAVAEALATART